MADETVSATTIMSAPAEAIFAVLAEPANHPAIDGTGWVCESLDSWLARSLHLDPMRQLERRWGKKLTVFTTGSDTKQNGL